jgi:multiple sugar transport system permease protein
VVYLLWKWMYIPSIGLVNYFVVDVFHLVGTRPTWLANPDMALASIVLMEVWRYLGYNVLLLLVGLGSINRDLYEAARIDGAGAWHRFRYVTWPHLRPTFFTVTILTVIFCFKSFDLVWIGTQGGPAGASEVLPTLAYRLVFQQFQFGQGAAVLNLVFLVLLILSGVYLYALHREERAT